MIQVDNESYYWTNLSQVIQSIEMFNYYREPSDNPNVIKIEPLSQKGKTLSEFLIQGLNNTIKHGYDIGKNRKINLQQVKSGVKFILVDDLECNEYYLIEKNEKEVTLWNDTKKCKEVLRNKAERLIEIIDD